MVGTRFRFKQTPATTTTITTAAAASSNCNVMPDKDLASSANFQIRVNKKFNNNYDTESPSFSLKKVTKLIVLYKNWPISITQFGKVK